MHSERKGCVRRNNQIGSRILTTMSEGRIPFGEVALGGLCAGLSGGIMMLVAAGVTWTTNSADNPR